MESTPTEDSQSAALRFIASESPANLTPVIYSMVGRAGGGLVA